jgi:hypothetical protein
VRDFSGKAMSLEILPYPMGTVVFQWVFRNLLRTPQAWDTHKNFFAYSFELF